ncbi:hypothetical protein, partial [Serratia proteamaculans]
MWLFTGKSDENADLCSALPKKSALEKFFAFRGCGLLRTPYNAPPLTGNNDSSNENQVAGSGREKRNKRLTLQVKSVIYATS